MKWLIRMITALFLLKMSSDLELQLLAFIAVYLVYSGIRDWAGTLSPEMGPDQT